jgi:polysaccharide biosynthesis/export protein
MLLRCAVLAILVSVHTLVAAQQPQLNPVVLKDNVVDGKKLAAPDEKQNVDGGYVLGSGDQITVHVVNCDEITDKPTTVDVSGYIHLPLTGSLQVSGRTVQQLQADIEERLKKYVLNPDVSVSVIEFRSQPVSVIGAVRNPGVMQVQGHKTLLEMLSLAGGLDPQTAGSTVNVTRDIRWGRIPLPNASDDTSKRHSIAEINLRSLINAKNPDENIAVEPNDVISVPRAPTVYVIGEVQKAGGYVLNDREDVTVLQALSMAGGVDKMAKPQDARILRLTSGSVARMEIPVNVSKILEGKNPDVRMQADDILFVPNNVSKRAAVRAIEAMIQTGSGILIWSHP